MQFSTLAQLVAFMGVASAAPKPFNSPLNHDDVLLLGKDGEHKLIKHSEFQTLQDRGLLEVAPATVQARAGPPNPPITDAKQERSTEKRCDESEEVQITSDESFVDWDVPMSSVVSAAGGGVSVGITSGFMLANAVTITGGLSGTIESVLGVSLSVAYAKTWTTTGQTTITYTVPDGQYGLIVSQPMVRRVMGNLISGCTDSPTTTGYMSDTYTDQSYGNLDWVTGVIRLCNSTEYPVPYCIGTGFHS